jgi:hypothetical protein
MAPHTRTHTVRVDPRAGRNTLGFLTAPDTARCTNERACTRRGPRFFWWVASERDSFWCCWPTTWRGANLARSGRWRWLPSPYPSASSSSGRTDFGRPVPRRSANRSGGTTCVLFTRRCTRSSRCSRFAKRRSGTHGLSCSPTLPSACGPGVATTPAQRRSERFGKHCSHVAKRNACRETGR